jgi:hypothetical protein
MNWILKMILNFGSKRLDGYKSQIGGIGFVLTGMGAMATAVTGGIRLMFPAMTQLPEMDVKTITETFTGGTISVSLGFTALGIGHKMEKQKTATIEQTQAILNQSNLIANKPKELAESPITTEC